MEYESLESVRELLKEVSSLKEVLNLGNIKQETREKILIRNEVALRIATQSNWFSSRYEDLEYWKRSLRKALKMADMFLEECEEHDKFPLRDSDIDDENDSLLGL